MTDLAKLRRHRELGTKLLGDFMNATPETATELVEREDAWMHDLIPLVEPHGNAVAARFEPITLMRPEEFEVLMPCVPLDELFNRVRMCHATRLYRLEKLFQQLSTVPRMVVAPARKTGRHPGHGALDDADAVAEMKRLVATGMTPWSASSEAEHLADQNGISEMQNCLRIYKKYMRFHG
jgi:hypothetical protein